MAELQITLRIDSKGSLTTLYQDNHPCLKIDGNLTVSRASDIRFIDGFWHIFKKQENREVKLGRKHKLRSNAILEEIELLNKELCK